MKENTNIAPNMQLLRSCGEFRHRHTPSCVRLRRPCTGLFTYNTSGVTVTGNGEWKTKHAEERRTEHGGEPRIPLGRQKNLCKSIQSVSSVC